MTLRLLALGFCCLVLSGCVRHRAFLAHYDREPIMHRSHGNMDYCAPVPSCDCAISNPNW